MSSNQMNLLLQPGKIGTMEVKNRIVMSPMSTEYADADNHVTKRQIDFYVERAKGGIGLIILEASYIEWPLARGFTVQIALHDDKYLPGLSHLAEAINKNGARSAVQLFHAGNAAHAVTIEGLQPIAPSAVSYPNYEPTRALTIREIKEITNAYIEAALRCKKAGFDAVEVHAAHQYLLASFLSPAWNKRRDEYGGDIRNRARFLIEVLRGIKEKVDIPIICRVNAREYGAKELFGVKQETTVEDAQETAKLIEANGADAIHISTWGYGPQQMHGLFPLFPGERLHLCEAIRKEISIPVVAYGRLTPEVGESALREGKADFIGIGRGLLTDPYLPQKVAMGEISDIAPCICCYKCMPVTPYGYETTGLACTVNARCGHEEEYPFPMTTAQKPKKVLVIGGGPGGMEAARISAFRGHNVTLYEKTQELGGQLLSAAKAPFKQNISLLTEYLKGQLDKAGVKVEIGKEATKEKVLAQQADAVIVATGSQAIMPKINGVEKAKLVSALDVLGGTIEVGEKVIILGGNMVGCEVAEFLAGKGKRVTICEVLPELLTKMDFRLQRLITTRINAQDFAIYLGVTSEQITEDGMIIIDRDGEEHLLPADTIVTATGAKPNNELFLELEGKVPEIYCIGDALEPRWILDAVHEGFRTAYSL